MSRLFTKCWKELDQRKGKVDHVVTYTPHEGAEVLLLDEKYGRILTHKACSPLS